MELYWLLRLPHLREIFMISAMFAIILWFVIFLVWMQTLGEYPLIKNYNGKKHMIIMTFFTFLFLVAGALCPNKTDIALMMSWDALKSDSVQEVIEILKDKIK